jgi:hypothetical protein
LSAKQLEEQETLLNFFFKLKQKLFLQLFNMEFDASLYNQTNRYQYKDAEKLINKIKEENSNKYVTNR